MGREIRDLVRKHRHERTESKVARKQGSKRSYDRILIVCEGEKTEVNYFEAIRKEKRLPSADIVIVRSDYGTSPQQIVEYAEDFFHHKNKVYDRIYVVFDRDDHQSYNNALTSAAARDKKLKNDNGSKGLLLPSPRYRISSYGFCCISATCWHLSIATTSTRSSGRWDVIRLIPRARPRPMWILTQTWRRLTLVPRACGGCTILTMDWTPTPTPIPSRKHSSRCLTGSGDGVPTKPAVHHGQQAGYKVPAEAAEPRAQARVVPA